MKNFAMRLFFFSRPCGGIDRIGSRGSESEIGLVRQSSMFGIEN